jgi:hypothetical protein
MTMLGTTPIRQGLCLDVRTKQLRDVYKLTRGSAVCAVTGTVVCCVERDTPGRWATVGWCTVKKQIDNCLYKHDCRVPQQPTVRSRARRSTRYRRRLHPSLHPCKIVHLPLDCHCNTGVNRQYRRGVNLKRLLTYLIRSAATPSPSAASAGTPSSAKDPC